MDDALDILPDDPAALKAIILAQRETATRLEASVKACETLVHALKVRIAKLNRQKFGRSGTRYRRDQMQGRERAMMIKRDRNRDTPRRRQGFTNSFV